MSAEKKDVEHKSTEYKSVEYKGTEYKNAEYENTEYDNARIGHTAENGVNGNMRDKREAAVRLFGALSGVDEKYLAECEKEPVWQEEPLRWNWKYGRAVAAVLMLAVLVAGYVGVQSLGDLRLGGEGSKNGITAQDAPAAVMPSSAAIQEVEEEAAEDVPAEGMAAAMAEDGYDAAELYAVEKDTAVDLYAYLPKVWPESDREEGGIGSDSSIAVTEAMPGGGTSNATNGDMTDGTDGKLHDNTRGRANGGANEGSGNGMDGETISDLSKGKGASGESADDSGQEASKEKQENQPDEETSGVETEWILTVQRDRFRLSIRVVEPETMKALGYDMKIYPVEGFDRSCVEEQMAGGAGNFGVLYSENGVQVLVEFEGSGTVDGVWEMFASIRP